MRILVIVVAFLALLGSTAFGNVRIAFDSTGLDFGGMALTSTRTLTIEFWDTTTEDIGIDRISIIGLNPFDFTFTSDSTAPFVVHPAWPTHEKLVVKFQPGALGPRSATLFIETTDG